jgi:UDP-N-acetyl-D-mannosaminuronic acid dehydrogenase
MKIAVYGQGKMGLPLAQVLAEKHDVIGVDVNEALVSEINRGGCPINEPGLKELLEKNLKSRSYSASTDFQKASDEASLHIILVPTLIKDGKADLSIVRDVAAKISKGLEKGDIVVTESTMPPGSTGGLIPILEKPGLKLGDFGLGHCPERTMSGTAIRDIRGRNPKIIGASDTNTGETLKRLYGKINSEGVILMSSIKAAELVKVFQGCYRDANIALANELAYVCEREGVGSGEVFEAANSDRVCFIHNPGYVGGHCIPYYPWFVIDEKTELMRKGREVNEGVIDRLAEKVMKVLENADKKPEESKILVLGLTFRGGVYEFEHSAAWPFIRKIKEKVAEVYAYDPLCREEDYKSFGAGRNEGFDGIDCIVILADHKEFKDMDFNEAKKGGVSGIVDGKNMLDSEKIRELGLVYESL